MSDQIITGISDVADGTYNAVNNIILNPSVIIILVGITLLYIVFFVVLGEQSTVPVESVNMVSNSSSNTIYIIMIAIFVVLVIVNGLQYFFGMDIVAKLKDILSGNPKLDITVDTSNILPPKKKVSFKPEVFNISENQYSYPDAEAVCSAYGARLASYTELEDAYKEGADWCNYGWSEGQMALFPTQKATFDGLQKIEGHENDCGRPGINGGYMANPALRFGVNCYGRKPNISPAEEERMANDPIYPKTEKDIAMEKRVQYWKDRLTSILVNPFNYKNWSAI
jgi:hypothetical protein